MLKNSDFQIVDAHNPLWQEAFERIPAKSKDVFYSPGYARLCQETLYRDHRVQAAVLVTDDAVVLKPFVQRSLSKILPVPLEEEFFDVTGLYGRNGLICDEGGTKIAGKFDEKFAAFCQAEKVICIFDRYHPVIGNDIHACAETQVQHIGEFVCVDLTPPINQIEDGFRRATKRSLRKAERAKVEVFWENNLDHVDDFLAVYTETMDSNAARDFYYFDRDFYEKLPSLLGGCFSFFYATLEGKIVSTELVLHSQEYGHSFLGGTLSSAREAAPNHLLKRAIIRTLKGQGCAYFLLGGGFQENDGIQFYKSSFAPSGGRESKIGGLICNRAKYDNLRKILTDQGMSLSDRRIQFYDLG